MGVDPPRERFNMKRPTVQRSGSLTTCEKKNLLEYVDQDEVLYVEQELICLYHGGKMMADRGIIQRKSTIESFSNSNKELGEVIMSGESFITRTQENNRELKTEVVMIEGLLIE